MFFTRNEAALKVTLYGALKVTTPEDFTEPIGIGRDEQFWHC